MRDLIDTVVVVAVLGEVALDLVIGNKAGLIANDLDLGVLDGGKRVGHDGETGNAGGKPTMDVLVMQGHLQALVAVLIMHVVNDVERIHIHAREPRHHVAVLGNNVVVVEVVAAQLDDTSVPPDRRSSRHGRR